MSALIHKTLSFKHKNYDNIHTRIYTHTIKNNGTHTQTKAYACTNAHIKHTLSATLSTIKHTKHTKHTKYTKNTKNTKHTKHIHTLGKLNAYKATLSRF